MSDIRFLERPPETKPLAASRLVTSSSNAVRIGKGQEHLGSLLGGSEIVLVAPTRAAVDDFARACGSRYGSLFGVHRTTLTGLVANLATDAMVMQNLAPVTRLGVEALAAHSIHRCRGRLSYFGPVADTPGFPRTLALTLSELRMEAIDRAALAASGDPGYDLSFLLECYEQEFQNRSLADYALMCELAKRIAEDATHRLLGLPLLLLDVAPDSIKEQAVLRAVVARASSVFATALAEDEQSVAILQDLLQVKAERLDDDAEPKSLERLRRSIFSSSLTDSKRVPLDASVHFFSAPGEALECVEIARRIRTAADNDNTMRTGGVPFDQIAILLRNPDAYLPLVEDALRRAGIEAYFTKGTIRPDPAGRAFLALLACAEEGLTASRFAEYLSLGQVPPVTESGAPPAPELDALFVPSQDELQYSFRFPDNMQESRTTTALGSTDQGNGTGRSATTHREGLPQLTDSRPDMQDRTEAGDGPVLAGTLRTPFDWEKLLVDAAVIGGKDRWSRRLRGLENEFRLKLEEAEAEADGETERQYLLKQLDHLRHLKNFALPVIEFLGGLPQNSSWGEWLNALRRLAGMALRWPDSVLSVLSELQPMEDVGPVSLPEVREVLTERLSLLRREPPSKRYGRVFVGSVDEIHGRSFEIVFLPGLAEGVFPRRPSEDPLLLDNYRKTLSPALDTREERAEREKLMLRSSVAAARSRFCASYPRMDLVQGRPRVPSVFALEVLRAAEGHLPIWRELETRAIETSEARLGWPAPKDPKDALDDAEYDLAVLEPLLHRPAEEIRGHGAYLVEASPTLARSLRTRWQRWSWKWSEVDGIYNPDPATLAILAKHRMTERSYSPSALQNYAICPYRFLLQAVHRLRERDQAVAIERLDPLTRGGLFHEVQFRLFRALQSERLLPVTAENLQRVMDVADEVYKQIVQKWAEDLAPAIPQVWQSEIEDLRTDLRGWTYKLAEIHREWLPFHFEYAFGLPPGPARDTERDPESISDPVVILENVKLRGSIDLVERHVKGNVLRVTDHKTGRAPWPEPRYVGKGEVLQPLLYALAAEKMLAQPVKSGVLFYCTQRGNYKSVEISLTAESRKWIRQVIRTIDDAIQRGVLPAAPRAGACRICDYESVCGPREEARLKRKESRLDALEDLRCLP
jgi:CRISPR/Cas system-associated exonuclease Cas4 (RecB family)